MSEEDLTMEDDELRRIVCFTNHKGILNLIGRHPNALETTRRIIKMKLYE